MPMLNLVSGQLFINVDRERSYIKEEWWLLTPPLVTLETLAYICPERRPDQSRQLQSHHHRSH